MNLIYGPHPIFKKRSETISEISEEVVNLAKELEELLYNENAVGVAAPMIGVLKRIISYDLQENAVKKPITMINPEIIWVSEELQIFEEGSICFPGVTLKIERPKSIKVRFQSIDGKLDEQGADGWLSAIIQHEIDYLDGKTIFDHLSPIKQRMAFKKTRKFQKEMKFI